MKYDSISKIARTSLRHILEIERRIEKKCFFSYSIKLRIGVRVVFIFIFYFFLCFEKPLLRSRNQISICGSFIIVLGKLLNEFVIRIDSEIYKYIIHRHTYTILLLDDYSCDCLIFAKRKKKQIYFSRWLKLNYYAVFCFFFF